MFRSPRVRHALPLFLYALAVWLLLLLIAACLAPQDASWLPAALWKYFPRPTPYAARVLGAATVALLRAGRNQLAGRAEATGQEHDASDSAKVRLHRRPVGFPPRATRPEESAFPGHPNPHQKRIHS